MHEHLESYIEQLTTPDNAALLFKSIDLMDQIGYIDHIDDIDYWVEEFDTKERISTLTNLFHLTRSHLYNIIRSYGVTVSDQTPHHLMNTVLDALTSLKTYGDPSYLLNGFQAEFDDETCCLTVLSRCSGLSESAFSPYIDACDSAALTAFKTLLEARVAAEPPAHEDIAKQRHRVQRYLINTRQNPALEFVKMGARLGSPIEALIRHFDEWLLDYQNQPTGFAEQVLGLLLVSSLDDSEFDATFKVLADDYLGDVNAITTAYQTFLTLLKNL